MKPIYIYNNPNIIGVIVGVVKKGCILVAKKSDNDLIFKKILPLTQNITTKVISELNDCVKINPNNLKCTIKFSDCVREFNILDLQSDYLVMPNDLDDDAENFSQPSPKKQRVDYTQYLKIFKNPIIVELKDQTKSAKSNIVISKYLDSESIKFSDLSHEMDYDNNNTKDVHDLVKAKISTMTKKDVMTLIYETPILLTMFNNNHNNL